MTRNALMEIDEENQLAYIYLQPERKGEKGAISHTEEHEQDSSVNPVNGTWQHINVDYDDQNRIFGIELIGFKI